MRGSRERGTLVRSRPTSLRSTATGAQDRGHLTADRWWDAVPTRAVPAPVKAPARAFCYQWLLDEGRYASIGEMAAAERIERGYLGTLLRMTLLAPEIVEAVLDGGQADNVTLPRLLGPFPATWADQGKALDAGSRA